jgi:uncharacterized protein (TIGR00725 family)
MGSSTIFDPRIEEMAVRIGGLIARSKATLITGATTGYSHAAARGATERGGEVIGFSPAINAAEHLRQGRPGSHHDWIIYTGLSSAGRNILNIRASLAVVFIGGSMGALNEFTIAYDEQKIIGILEGSGGFCNSIKDWLPGVSKPNNHSVIHYSPDPDQLMNAILQTIRIAYPSK